MRNIKQWLMVLRQTTTLRVVKKECVGFTPKQMQRTPASQDSHTTLKHWLAKMSRTGVWFLGGLVLFMPTAFAKQGVVNCQGIPADRAAIQAAIDDLSNNQVLLKGLCQLDGQQVLIFRSNFTLKGELGPNGEPLTVVKGLENADGSPVETDTSPGAHPFNFFNRGIEVGTPTANSTVSNVVIKDLHMRSHKRTIAISPELGGSTGNLCEDTVVNEGSTASSIKIQNILVTNSVRGPQTFGAVSNTSFANIRAKDPNGGGIFEPTGLIVSGGGVGCFIDEADAEDGLTSVAIDLGSASEVTVKSNHVEPGFDLGMELNSCANCTVKSNQLEGTIFNSISVARDGTGSKITNNTIINGGGANFGICGGSYPADTAPIMIGLCAGFGGPPANNWVFKNNQISGTPAGIPDVLFADESTDNTYIYNDPAQVIYNTNPTNEIILK